MSSLYKHICFPLACYRCVVTFVWCQPPCWAHGYRGLFWLVCVCIIRVHLKADKRRQCKLGCSAIHSNSSARHAGKHSIKLQSPHLSASCTFLRSSRVPEKHISKCPIVHMSNTFDIHQDSCACAENSNARTQPTNGAQFCNQAGLGRPMEVAWVKTAPSFMF